MKIRKIIKEGKEIVEIDMENAILFDTESKDAVLDIGSDISVINLRKAYSTQTRLCFKLEHNAYASYCDIENNLTYMQILKYGMDLNLNLFRNGYKTKDGESIDGISLQRDKQRE